MMMRKAGRYHFARTLPLAVVVFLAFSGMAAIAWLKWQDEVVRGKTDRAVLLQRRPGRQRVAGQPHQASPGFARKRSTNVRRIYAAGSGTTFKRLFYPNPPSLEQGRPLAAVAFTDESKVISVSKSGRTAWDSVHLGHRRQQKLAKVPAATRHRGLRSNVAQTVAAWRWLSSNRDILAI